MSYEVEKIENDAVEITAGGQKYSMDLFRETDTDINYEGTFYFTQIPANAIRNLEFIPDDGNTEIWYNNHTIHGIKSDDLKEFLLVSYPLANREDCVYHYIINNVTIENMFNKMGDKK